MRKQVCTTCVFALLLLTSFTVCAETNRRGLTEFCELYMRRITQMEQDRNMDFDIHIFNSNFGTFDSYNDDKYHFVTSGAIVDCYKDDFTISEAWMLFMDLENSSEIDLLSCLAAFSALEYSQIDESLFSIKSTYTDCEETAVLESKRIFENEIIPKLTDEFCGKLSNTKEEQLIYSGNYDYYMLFQDVNIDEIEISKQMVRLIAKEHE